MSDTLILYGKTYSDVVGFQAVDSNNEILYYVRPENAVGNYIIDLIQDTHDPSLFTPEESFATIKAGIEAAQDANKQVVMSYGDSLTTAFISSGFDMHIPEIVDGSYYFYSYIRYYTAYRTYGTNEIVFRDMYFGPINGVDTVAIAYEQTYIVPPTQKYSSDLTVSGATVTVPAGWYQSNASKSVASGTAGTPSATKGNVSNHSVSVTPSVTNSAGYISGGTITGTAVSVSASELVSGSETKTANGTYDVTNLASLVVAVPFATISSGTSDPSGGSNGDIYIKTAS